MPVRLRITLLFTFLVFIILALVGLSVYFSSSAARTSWAKTRLTNRCITMGRLLSQPDVFSNELVRRIDSSTSHAFLNKGLEAYDFKNNKIYSYNSLAGDSIKVAKEILEEARVNGSVYYTAGKKDVVAYHYTDENARFVILAAGEDHEGKHNLKQLSKILVVCFSIGLLIALFSGYFFSKGLLKPIKKITDDVNDITARNFSRRINTGSVKDEWYYLSDTLNALLVRLKQSFDLQKRFISNASHELSTPLTSVSSQIEVSLQRERSPEEYKQVMRSIHQDVLHMSKLTQMLLQLAKTSEDDGGLEISLVRIDEVLFRLPAEISKVSKDYSVSFNLDDLPEDEEKLLVFGNEELLCAAIKNIVVNACKYSGSHTANVKLKIEKDEVIISVQDTGMGIPKDELANIFQPFYQVSGDKAKDGFGLGLSMVSKIIKLHNGVINVESVVGKGTLFTVTIPRSKASGKKF